MLSLSSTAISDAATCLKKYEDHFEDRIVPRPEKISRAIRRGIWLHRCLQDHHTGKDWQKSLARLLGQALNWHLDEEAMQEIYDECRLLMISYQHYYTEPLGEPVADEQEYRWTFGGVELRATVDLAVRDARGDVWIVEHKSTADIPPASWRAVDPQTALQTVLMLANGIPVKGVLFNYIDTTPKVPRITSKGQFHGATGVTTSAHFGEAATALLQVNDDVDYLNEQRAALVDDAKFFQRYYAEKQPEILRETMRDIAGIADRVTRAKAAGHFPRSFNVFSCKSCFYFNLCVTEYVSGQRSDVIRNEQYQHDDGYREGNVK